MYVHITARNGFYHTEMVPFDKMIICLWKEKVLHTVFIIYLFLVIPIKLLIIYIIYDRKAAYL